MGQERGLGGEFFLFLFKLLRVLKDGVCVDWNLEILIYCIIFNKQEIGAEKAMSDYFIEEKETIHTILESDTELEGELSFETSLKIKGKFKGRIQTSGLLVIDATAEVEADIQARDVVLAGSLKGNITALNRVELDVTSKLSGDIKTYKLKIADGVFFEGACEMLTPEELAKLVSLPVVSEKTV